MELNQLVESLSRLNEVQSEINSVALAAKSNSLSVEALPTGGFSLRAENVSMSDIRDLLQSLSGESTTRTQIQFDHELQVGKTQQAATNNSDRAAMTVALGLVVTVFAVASTLVYRIVQPPVQPVVQSQSQLY